jgi:hypothetical protein
MSSDQLGAFLILFPIIAVAVIWYAGYRYV